jgi:hypothetical protein
MDGTVSESNDAVAHINGNTSAGIPFARYSSLFESSNPLLPEPRLEEPFQLNSCGLMRGQPQRRSSSLASISQRSSWLANVLQEAIDVSSTVELSDDDDEDDVTGSCNTDEHY